MGQVQASFISFFGRGGGGWLLIIKLNVNLTNFCQGLMQVNSINGPGSPVDWTKYDERLLECVEIGDADKLRYIFNYLGSIRQHFLLLFSKNNNNTGDCILVNYIKRLVHILHQWPITINN